LCLSVGLGPAQTICPNGSAQLSATGGVAYQWSPATGLSNIFSSNPIANPTVSTTYCVTVTDVSGCTGVGCTVVNVENNLAPNAGPDQTICRNSSAQLTASGGTSYQWSPTIGLNNAFINNPIATPSTTTTYCVTVTDATGCTGIDCVTIAVDNNSNPNAGLDQMVCNGGSTQLQLFE